MHAKEIQPNRYGPVYYALDSYGWIINYATMANKLHMSEIKFRGIMYHQLNAVNYQANSYPEQIAFNTPEEAEKAIDWFEAALVANELTKYNQTTMKGPDINGWYSL